MRRCRFAAVLLFTTAITIYPLVATASVVQQEKPTPAIQDEQIYIVRPGDTLFRIAGRFGTTYPRLAEANGITNPAMIYVGQRLRIPGVPAATVTPTPVAGGGLLPDMPTISTTGYGFDYGIQVYSAGQDIRSLTDTAASLGMRWVRVVVNWRDFEPVKGQIDFSDLDKIVDEMNATEFNVLLTVTAAPAWARTSTDEDGPPDNFADYGIFMGALAQHYAGRVRAYEIWNEPNLRREWNSTIHSIGAASYIELLRVGYAAIKAADSYAIVVSGGLSPTGFNDGVNAINDRLFLRDLYRAGLAATSDAIGAHPRGWANPPDSVCCSPAIGVISHYEDPSFYFLNTLRDYRQIIVESGDSTTAIWVTEFGWGTSEDTDPPSETQVFVSYTSLEQQAAYIPRALELGAELGYIGPMFLHNLNGCQAQPADTEACYYSLIGPDGKPRPAFAAVQQQLNPTATEQPSPTSEATPQATAAG
ncbi:MAG: LysM peptidoglycan-binding domain-containing protein [Chloroflexi bacterium]|nr:LysM peptidoglycan-binding domain-containing protein [Chloroflexota bacterium]